MKYPAQSDLWRLDYVTKARPITNSGGQSRVLGRFRQIFMFTLFPDDLLVEELRIVWINRMGPWANKVVSIMATDIACVYAAADPFYGHIHVQSLTGGPKIFVDNLLKKDVLKIRSLVEGIALSAREGLKINGGDLEMERQNLMEAGAVN